MKNIIKKKANVFIKTYGCSANQADSLYMKRRLEEAGYEISNYENSDVVIINSCTVKNNAETKLFRALRNAKESKKKVIAAGCVVDAEKGLANDDRLKDVGIIGTRNLDDIVRSVDEIIAGKRTVFWNGTKKDFHKLNYNMFNKTIAIVPIAEGCLGNCSYCKTKQARGVLQSYPKKDIICQIETFLREGAKEIWLTSQDLANYGLDIRESFIELMKDIDELNGEFWVRLGMSNPNHLLRIVDDFNEVIAGSKHFFRFLHIPVQSGSDMVLKMMNRGYSANDFLMLFKKIKNKIPAVSLATDVIVGFPHETEEDFKKSVELIKEIKPDVLNISRFWARPGTRAAAMEQLKPEVGIERAKILKDVFNEIVKERNKDWVGWKGKALIDEKGKLKTMKARNLWYKQLIIPNEEIEKKLRIVSDESIGHWINVEIVGVSGYSLIARII